MVVDEKLITHFVEESANLLNDLNKLGESLKDVGVPKGKDSLRLWMFAQKLNRLIGGTAAMGFEMFAPLSRKTSLLAAKCAEVQNMTIRVLIVNLNAVVTVLGECFGNLNALEEIRQKIPELEKRVDICMTAVGLESPDIKTQNEIDDIFNKYSKQ